MNSRVAFSLICFFRGVLATVQAGAQNWGGLMAIRFLLGAFEAAYALVHTSCTASEANLLT